MVITSSLGELMVDQILQYYLSLYPPLLHLTHE